MTGPRNAREKAKPHEKNKAPPIAKEAKHPEEIHSPKPENRSRASHIEVGQELGSRQAAFRISPALHGWRMID